MLVTPTHKVRNTRNELVRVLMTLNFHYCLGANVCVCVYIYIQLIYIAELNKHVTIYIAEIYIYI